MTLIVDKKAWKLKDETALEFQRRMEAKGFKANFIVEKETKNDQGA